MAATGRPRFEPTEKQRGQVEAMARYGIPETEIARTIGVSKPTLLKYFRDELDTGATKANAQVGEFIFSTILGVPIPGRPPVTDAAWDMLMFRLRLGDDPRVVVTTTPK